VRRERSERRLLQRADSVKQLGSSPSSSSLPRDASCNSACSSVSRANSVTTLANLACQGIDIQAVHREVDAASVSPATHPSSVAIGRVVRTDVAALLSGSQRGEEDLLAAPSARRHGHPSVAVPKLVIGGHSTGMESSCKTTGDSNEQKQGAEYANYAFRITLYVDEIQAEAPAVVVWNFLKGTFLRLTAREPRFRAERGYYSESNTACTPTPRQYYGFNVVKLRSVKPVGTTEGGEKCVAVSFSLYYDNHRRVRSVFVLTVYATQAFAGSVGQLLTMQMQLKNQEHVVGERDLQTLALQNPTTRPTMMFTPQLFRNVSNPSHSSFTRSGHRDVGREVWRLLGVITDGDWAHYQQIRKHFTQEYRKKLESFARFASDAVDAHAA